MRPDNTWDPTSERAKKVMRSEKSEEREAPEADTTITDVLVDDHDDESDGGDNNGGGCLDPGLSKCLVHLPRNWNSEKLSNFLREQASKGNYNLLICLVAMKMWKCTN